MFSSSPSLPSSSPICPTIWLGTSPCGEGKGVCCGEGTVREYLADAWHNKVQFAARPHAAEVRIRQISNGFESQSSFLRVWMLGQVVRGQRAGIYCHPRLREPHPRAGTKGGTNQCLPTSSIERTRRTADQDFDEPRNWSQQAFPLDHVAVLKLVLFLQGYSVFAVRVSWFLTISPSPAALFRRGWEDDSIACPRIRLTMSLRLLPFLPRETATMAFGRPTYGNLLLVNSAFAPPRFGA